MIFRDLHAFLFIECLFLKLISPTATASSQMLPQDAVVNLGQENKPKLFRRLVFFRQNNFQLVYFHVENQ